MTKRRHNSLGCLGTLVTLALAFAPSALAQRQIASQLTLEIRPQAVMVQAGEAISLKIRLAQGTSAMVWADQDSCSVPSPTGRTIQRSGSYQIPASELGNGNRVCVASSDGAIRLSNLLR